MLPSVLLQMFYLLWELSCRVYILLLNNAYECYYVFQPRNYIDFAPKSEIVLSSATEIQKMIISGKFGCEEVVSAFIERIKNVGENTQSDVGPVEFLRPFSYHSTMHMFCVYGIKNSSQNFYFNVNPVINAVLFDNFHQAMEQAREIDILLASKSYEQRKELSRRFSLLCVPLSVKNNMHVKGFPVTNGLVAWKDNVTDENAEVVQIMLSAGAIILGLTNIPPECGSFESTNEIIGTTSNPYDTRRSAGGSSGGEGALIASAGSTIGIGTDSAGSIRVPAMFCGIFGMKPTPFSITHRGIEPINETTPPPYMTTVGPLCRYSEDLLTVFKVMVTPSKLQQMRPAVSMKDLQIFSFSGFSQCCAEPVDFEQARAFRRVLRHFEEDYGKSVIPIDILHQREMYTIARASLSSKGVEQEDHVCNSDTESCRLRQETDHSMERLLGVNGILIMPGWPTTASYHNLTLFKWFNLEYTAIWNAMGLPVVTVPLGLDSQGLPMSVQIIANRYSDLTLINVAQLLDGNNKKCKNKKLFPGYVPPWTLKKP